MAIQFRRGAYEHFDPSRLLPGEPAVVTSGDPNAADGKAAYICFASGDVKRMSTAEDIAAFMARAEGAVERAENAAEAVEDVMVDEVPLMSADIRGGAQLGDGLAVASGRLSALPMTEAQIQSVADDEGPSGSGLLNLTGLSSLWAKLKSAFAALAHTHAASDVTSGELPIARGGTGAATAAAARSNLGITPANIGAAASTHTHAASDIASDQLAIANGGTGAATAAAALANLGAASTADLAQVQSVADDASSAVGDLAAAVGTVDVATDGSLQAQIDKVWDSVSPWILSDPMTGFVVYGGHTKTVQLNQGDGPAVRIFVGSSGIRIQYRASPSDEWQTKNSFF